MQNSGFSLKNQVIGYRFLVVITLMFSTSIVNSEKLISESLDNRLNLPAGFKAVVVVDSTGVGRHLTVNNNGDIYISLNHLKNKKGIVALRDTNGDGKADIIQYFGEFSGTGIGIHNGYLYFGSDTILVRYKLHPGELLPNPSYEIVANGFIHTHQHEAKPFTFDNDGNVYVNFGAPSNACQINDRTPGSPG